MKDNARKVVSSASGPERKLIEMILGAEKFVLDLVKRREIGSRFLLFAITRRKMIKGRKYIF